MVVVNIARLKNLNLLYFATTFVSAKLSARIVAHCILNCIYADVWSSGISRRVQGSTW